MALEAISKPSQNSQEIDPYNITWDLCQIDHFLHVLHSLWHILQTHLCLNRNTFCYQRYRPLFKNGIPHSASTYLLNKVQAIIPPQGFRLSTAARTRQLPAENCSSGSSPSDDHAIYQAQLSLPIYTFVKSSVRHDALQTFKKKKKK